MLQEKKAQIYITELTPSYFRNFLQQNIADLII